MECVFFEQKHEQKVISSFNNARDEEYKEFIDKCEDYFKEIEKEIAIENFTFAVTSPLQVLLFRFTERIGKGIRTAPRDSLIAGSSSEEKTGRSFGFHKAMDNSGAIVGPLLAFAVLAAFPGDYRIKTELMRKISFRDLPRSYYIFMVIAFIFTLGNSTDALLLVKANDIGINALFIPLVYLIFNSVSVIFSVPAGMLSAKIGRERLIIFGYLLYSIIYFGFGRTNDKTAVIMLFTLYGLYSAATDGV